MDGGFYVPFARNGTAHLSIPLHRNALDGLAAIMVSVIMLPHNETAWGDNVAAAQVLDIAVVPPGAAGANALAVRQLGHCFETISRAFASSTAPHTCDVLYHT